MMRVKSLTQTLRNYFSNQPKNFQKPSPIEFDFKIPKRNIEKQSQESTVNNEVKIIKSKRNDVLKVLKKKKQNEEQRTKIEDSYQEKYQKKISDNLKTARYHDQQYLKGENLIQNIPLDPYYSYKLADFKRKIELEKTKFKEFIGPIIDYQFKAQTKNNIAELYHQKQQKYQIQEFVRHLDEYPGSPKGPKPEDDLPFYIQYALKKIPAVLANQIAANQAIKNKKKTKVNNNNLNDVDYFKVPQQGNYSQILNYNRALTPDAFKDYDSANEFDKTSKFPIYKDYEEVPDFPQLQFNNYQHWMRDMINWQNFKNHYIKKNSVDNLMKQIDYLNQVFEENDPNPDSPYYEFTPSAPSLLRYYKTLPKSVQDHPGVKNIYLGLEFYCNFFSYQEKQQALNMAAAMIQPLDKVSTRAMQDFIAKKKQYMTPFMVDKIFSINPQFTWDIQEFFAEIKRQQLKGQSMIKQNQGSFPEPPKKHLEWQEGTASLPVDFYDNDDGFWDEIITEKLKRQDQAQPIMRYRKHFTH